MQVFPLDNTEYEAAALGAWCGTRIRGVFAADNHYSVTPNGDMSITVSPGLAWLKMDEFWGVDAFEQNPTVLTIDTADGSLSRIDAVCIQLDKNNNKGSIILKKGTYAQSPSIPLIVQDDLNYDEIYVATIMVRAGTVEITAADISDQRLNKAYCGLMRDGVTGIPTEQLYAQFSEYLEKLKTAIDGVIDGSQYLLKVGYDDDGEVGGAGGIKPYVAGEIASVQEQVDEMSAYFYNETRIGTWIDGKPIYRKTINFGSLPNNGDKDVAHGIANMGQLICLTGIATGGGIRYPLPFVITTFANQIGLWMQTTTDVRIRTGTDRSNLAAIVIVEYTKTTD